MAGAGKRRPLQKRLEMGRIGNGFKGYVRLIVGKLST